MRDSVIRRDQGAPGLVTRKLSIRRGRRWVMRGLDWSWSSGGIAWVVGPNGVGKSSFLRVLAGLGSPAGGTVLRWGPGAGDAGVIYHEPSMSIPGDVTTSAWSRLLGALSGRMGPGVDPGLAPEAVIGVRRVRTLSTGERKRLVLDALLRLPSSHVYLDEPYEHLSAGAKRRLSACLRGRARSHVVVVATNQEPPVEPGVDAVLRLQADESVLAAGAGAP